MFPEDQDKRGIYNIPKLSFDRQDPEELLDALSIFHLEFKDCFSRSEPRHHFFRYMADQLTGVRCKASESGTRWVVGPGARAMQRFMGDVTWNEEMLLWKYHTLVSRDLGDPDGVLILDETLFPKKGASSAGVARQMPDAEGRTINCQVGVFAGYASRHGYALVDKRLFMPEAWFRDDHASARTKTMVPAHLCFKEKPALAAEMFRGVQKGGLLPFKYLVSGPCYGNSTDFICAAADAKDAIYLLPVLPDTLCRSPETATEGKPPARGGGNSPSGAETPAGDGPLSALTLAGRLDDSHWRRHGIVQGIGGPVDYEFAWKRVSLCPESLAGPSVWLIMRRTAAKKPAYSFFAGSAPPGTPLDTFAWLSGARLATAQCFEEARSALGMDRYEVRKYPAWNHHILTCMLAHFFLVRTAKRPAGRRSVLYSLSE